MSRKSLTLSDFDCEDDEADFDKDDEEFTPPKKQTKKKTKEQNKQNKHPGPGALLMCNTKRW